MFRRLAFLAVFLPLPSAPAQPDHAVWTFDNAESLSGWRLSLGREWPGAKGELNWRAADSETGGGAAAISFNFTGGGHYVAAICPLPAERDVRAVRLRLHKPFANKLIFRATDNRGETFQKDFVYHFPGWQRVEIELDRWLFSWGGDGEFQRPAREMHILVENEGGVRVGELLFDDVELLDAPGADPIQGAKGAGGPDSRSKYSESDFGGPDPWNYFGPAEGGYSDGALRYAFGDGADIVRLTRDRSLLGRPQKLALTLDSDGSGHEVVVRLGSHFQLFERSLGTLDKKGEITLEAPLGDLAGWQHYGGEDDGIVRYPLRIIDIGLHAKGGMREGKVGFERLTCETLHDCESETVWLSPDVVTRGEEAIFTVEGRSLLDRELTGTLIWSAYGGDRHIASGERELALPAAGRRAWTSFAVPWGDESVLEGRFQFRRNAISSPPVSTTLARAESTPNAVEREPSSRIGAGLYLYRFRGHPEGQRWMEQMCDLAATAGVRWTREEFHWNWIEPQRGQFDFEFFDRLVDTAGSRGISVYALCCYWTTWTEPCSERGFDDYCRYLEALVRRYGDRIRYWEIWNEPNVFFWNCSREQYATLLKRAYETIKRVDPDAQVLGCSTAGIDTGFIESVLNSGAPFDALTVHPYRGQLQAGPFIDELKSVQKLAGGRDVWITEMGWPSNIGGLTEREQAQFVARTYVSALASEAARNVAWYDFREDGDDPYYNEHNFGLVRADLRPKMGYRALAAVGRLFAEARFERRLALDVELVAFQFCDGERRIVALWSPEGTRLVRLALGGENPRLFNVVGDTANAVRENDTATFVLARATPVYMCFDDEPQIRLLPSPVRVELGQPSVHPGETVTLRITADAGATAIVSPPPGWRFEATDAPSGRLTAPTSALAGTHTIVIEVGWADASFEIPIDVNIVPELLRG